MEILDKWRELNLKLKTSPKNSGLIWLISEAEDKIRRLPPDQKPGDDAFNYCLSHFTTDNVGSICLDYLPRVRTFLGLVNDYQGHAVLYVKTACKNTPQNKVLERIEGSARFTDNNILVPGPDVQIPSELFGPYSIRNHLKIYTEMPTNRSNYLIWIGYENQYLTGNLPEDCSRIWKKLTLCE